jgi:hypothetical protein
MLEGVVGNARADRANHHQYRQETTDQHGKFLLHIFSFASEFGWSTSNLPA